MIKKKYWDTVIAFNNSGIVLSKRSPEDLNDLALMAHNSGDPSLIRLFEKLPSIDELKKAKMKAVINKSG